MNAERFQKLSLAISGLFPRMPLQEVFRLATLKIDDENLQPDDIAYIDNLVRAHARHAWTDYEKLLKGRVSEDPTLPGFVKLAARLFRKAVAVNGMPESAANASWRIFAIALSSEQADSVVKLWRSEHHEEQ